MNLSSVDDEAERNEAALRESYDALIRAYQTRVKDLEAILWKHRQNDAALRNDMRALIDAYRDLEASFFERHRAVMKHIRHEISALESES